MSYGRSFQLFAADCNNANMKQLASDQQRGDGEKMTANCH